MTPAELTPEEIRGLLEGTTLGPWQAGRWHRNGMSDVRSEDGSAVGLSIPKDDARLIAAAPDLARQLLAAMEENERLRSGDYCEHGIDCPGTGPDCARAGTLDAARQQGWAEAVRYGNDAILRAATLEGIVRRRQNGWIAVMDTMSLHPLQQVYGFSTPHWCKTNPYGGPITMGHPTPEPMSEAEVLILKEMQQ